MNKSMYVSNFWEEEFQKHSIICNASEGVVCKYKKIFLRFNKYIYNVKC